MAVVPTLGEIYEIARATLADVGADVYTDTVLSPFARRACHKAARYLRSRGSSIFRKEATGIAALSTTTKLERTAGGGAVLFPADMLRPIELQEKTALDTEYTALRCQNGFLPSDVPVGAHRQYWDWINDTIVFPAGTVATTLKLQYEANFTDPGSWVTTPNLTSIPIPEAGDAIGWLIASYALASRDERESAKLAYDMAMEDLAQIAEADANVATARAARYGRQ